MSMDIEQVKVSRPAYKGKYEAWKTAAIVGWAAATMLCAIMTIREICK